MEKGLLKRMLLAGTVIALMGAGAEYAIKKIKEHSTTPPYQTTQTGNNSSDLLYRLRAD